MVCRDMPECGGFQSGILRPGAAAPGDLEMRALRLRPRPPNAVTTRGCPVVCGAPHSQGILMHSRSELLQVLLPACPLESPVGLKNTHNSGPRPIKSKLHVSGLASLGVLMHSEVREQLNLKNSLSLASLKQPFSDLSAHGSHLKALQMAASCPLPHPSPILI